MSSTGRHCGRGLSAPRVRGLVLGLVFLGLPFLLSSCIGEDDAKKQAGEGACPAVVQQQAEAGEPAVELDGEAAPDKAPESAPPEEEVRVYALSEPLPPAPPEEQELAQRVVDYVNRVDRVLSSPCGRYPDLVVYGTAEYQTSFTTLNFGDNVPEARCLTKSVLPPAGLFDEEDRRRLVGLLEGMDADRADMHRHYEALREYVQDTSIVDDGKKGRSLVREIVERFGQYAERLEDLRTLLDGRGTQAQDVLLRDHPLRDHVRLAAEMVSVIRRVADSLAVAEPDPASLDEPVARLREDIDRAEHLPFPVAGEPEMYYRQFLKTVRSLLALMTRGQLESFHDEVRMALNADWNTCRRQYNAFVDALADKR